MRRIAQALGVEGDEPCALRREDRSPGAWPPACRAHGGEPV